MRTNLVDKDGRKVDMYYYVVCAREDLDHGTEAKIASEGQSSEHRYEMCEGCSKPVILHGLTFDIAIQESGLNNGE